MPIDIIKKLIVSTYLLFILSNTTIVCVIPTFEIVVKKLIIESVIEVDAKSSGLKYLANNRKMLNWENCRTIIEIELHFVDFFKFSLTENKLITLTIMSVLSHTEFNFFK